MGKGEEQPLPTSITHPQSTTPDANTCPCSAKFAPLFRFRCVLVLVLGFSVFVSAVFWLPPFLSHGRQGDLDLDSHYRGHDIVATFMIQKPLSLLEDDFPRLAGDIFDEIRIPTIKVVILMAERNDRLNTTKVIFGVDPYEYNSDISWYAKSLVRDSFVSLVLKQSPLALTESLFGKPSSFEVLKFVGGITVTPDQSSYPLQKVQIRFNFTLNFSIQQILDHFGELTSQLKSGLHLGPYENLHVSLTNPKGSTVALQTTVQASVVLVIGSPSMTRSKQLAQTIKGSPTKNLGLNNTQFGRVKQISLSSYINGGSDGGNGSPIPSPAPLRHPHPLPPTHHHHHHHHHHDKQLPPAKPPSHPTVHAFAPHGSHNAKPPDCSSGYNRKKKKPIKDPPLFPPVSQPVPPPRLQSLPPPPLQPPPTPPPVIESVPASGPLPNVVFAHTHPPSKSNSNADPPDTSRAGLFLLPSSAYDRVALRAIVTFVVMMIVQQT